MLSTSYLAKEDIFIIHTPKKVMWEKVLDILEDKGYSWDGANARKYWKIFRKLTCIQINNETKLMMFGRLSYYQNFKSFIFQAKDFISMFNNSHGFLGLVSKFVLKLRLKLRLKWGF